MDDLDTRAKHMMRLRELVSELAVKGGDAIVVLLGEAERLLLGCERYGALDLDEPHDWQLEEDEERMDIANYRAIKRAIARRGESRSSQRVRPTRSEATATAQINTLSRSDDTTRLLAVARQLGRFAMVAAEEGREDVLKDVLKDAEAVLVRFMEER